jgi:hypothetical protein
MKLYNIRHVDDVGSIYRIFDLIITGVDGLLFEYILYGLCTIGDLPLKIEGWKL